MTLAETIALGSILLAIAGLIFKAGRSEANHRETEAQLKKDVTGVANREREDIARQERRWLFDIADAVEAAEDKEQRTRLAQRIRQDAYRR